MIQFQILIDLDRVVVLRARHDILGVKGHGCDVILVAGEVAEPADRSSARAASLSCKGSRPRRRLLESAKDGLLQIRRAPLLHPLLGRGPVHHGGFFVLRHSYPLIGLSSSFLSRRLSLSFFPLNKDKKKAKIRIGNIWYSIRGSIDEAMEEC